MKYARALAIMAILVSLFPTCVLLPSTNSPVSIETLFAHGLGGDGTQAHTYQRKGFIYGAAHTFNFPDVDHLRQSCLAGRADVKAVREQLQSISSDKRIELYGLSRGAATVCRLAGMLTVQEQERVAAIIAESPFARYSDVVKNVPANIRASARSRIARLLSYPLQGSLASTPESSADQSMRIALPNSEPDYAPLHTIVNVPHHIPVLLICSRQDTLIPASSTIKLYKTLRLTGHPRVHLFVAQHGSHAAIISDRDRHRYLAIVHAFRKYYGLPHDQDWAERDQLFVDSQPNPHALTDHTETLWSRIS